MKLINYDYGYSNFFDCSIHGKILVTKEEWKKVIDYLKRCKPDTSYPFYKNLTLEEWQHHRLETPKGEAVNLRVWATSKIAGHFGLEKYRRANYIFIIK